MLFHWQKISSYSLSIHKQRDTFHLQLNNFCFVAQSDEICANACENLMENDIRMRVFERCMYENKNRNKNRRKERDATTTAPNVKIKMNKMLFVCVMY